MEPLATLDRLVAQYGISADFAWTLKPLVERAQRAPAGVRERLLRLAEQSAEREGRRHARAQAVERRRAEAELLRVARQLHAWSPSGLGGPGDPS